jgi:Aldehyde dehydrogenase family
MTTVAVPTLARYELNIGGTSVAASSGRTYETVNPYTGQSWATVADAGPEDVDAAAGAARAELNGSGSDDAARARGRPAPVGVGSPDSITRRRHGTRGSARRADRAGARRAD